MNATPDIALTAIAASIAAAVHVYMFAVESVFFDHPATLRMLEVPQQNAAAVRLWAYHQGAYNLLLGAMSAAGVVALLTCEPVAARTLFTASSIAMVAAAIALLAIDRRRARLPGFLAQAAPAVACLIALATSQPASSAQRRAAELYRACWGSSSRSRRARLLT